MLQLFRRKKTQLRKRDKIADPLQDAQKQQPGSYVIRNAIDQWEPWAARYTTTAHFGRVEEIRYFNNCGPTALTNLLLMAGKRFGQLAGDADRAKAVYHRVARFGVRHLYFINSRLRFAHGTSDLRAASYIRRMCRKLLGIRPRIRLHRVTRENVRRSLESGSLLYLMLWNHPAYQSHHLLAYGCEDLENTETGKLRTYLKVSDGHASAVRYLDLADIRGLYWEVRFPVQQAETGTASVEAKDPAEMPPQGTAEE